MFPPRSENGLTLLEILVAISVIAILASIGTICGGPGPHRGEMTQTLNNMRQLHLATQQMALDGTTTGNSKMSWPGDTGGTFSNWAQLLVPEYLSTNDFCKLVSAKGRLVPNDKIPRMKETAILVYAVKTESENSAVFLSSANFTNTTTGGTAPTTGSIPFGTNGFVVFRKGDNGAICIPKHAGNTNVIGTFAPLCR